jgi:hypothetical protein
MIFESRLRVKYALRCLALIAVLVPTSVGSAEEGTQDAPEGAEAGLVAPPAGDDAAVDEGTGDPVDATAPEEAPQSVLAAFLEDLSPETLKAKLAQFYDAAATLEDPFGRFEQRDTIERHLENLLKGTKSVTFEVRSEFQSGDETVALWTMSVIHPKLAGDEPVVIEGVTHARFVNGKIAEQRDFYDVGGLVYENVSVVGALVRWVKAKVLAP